MLREPGELRCGSGEGNCLWARAEWASILVGLNVVLGKSQRKAWSMLSCCVSWSIWLLRNKVIFYDGIVTLIENFPLILYRLSNGLKSADISSWLLELIYLWSSPSEGFNCCASAPSLLIYLHNIVGVGLPGNGGVSIGIGCGFGE
ncbi:hypothetical protein DKX38_023434 [Salix brachista]|uniref:Uncharacterized protein n=1 Tax=Salix brachista TaxID=2182728 RepID=A0A5N5JPT2_9ROSI|nr:hypothetical protein DKX38_023434 [Salix brachista]